MQENPWAPRTQLYRQWRKSGSQSGDIRIRPKGRTLGRSLEARRAERGRGSWGADVPPPLQLGIMGSAVISPRGVRGEGPAT